MLDKKQFLKKARIPSFFIIGLVFFCLFSGIKTGNQSPVVMNTESSMQESTITFTFGSNVTQDQVINDTIIIKDIASVTLTNSTINGDIYAFNYAKLSINQNSTINGGIFIFDDALLNLSSSNITSIQKSDNGNMIALNTTIGALTDVGKGGTISITECNVSTVTLYGLSQTFINNSNISVLVDNTPAIGIITGPIPAEFAEMGYEFSASERVNFTWIGFDNLIINGSLNISFQIFVDGVLYKEIDGSGDYNNYTGQCEILFNETGDHVITLVSIDGYGNSTNSSLSINIITYPTFDGLTFWITCIVAAAAVIIVLWLFKHQQHRGLQSALDVVFKQEIKKNKIKLPVFVGIGAVPGIILYFIFITAQKFLGGNLSMDSVRSIISTVYSMYHLYFGLAFSMVFAVGLVVNDRKNGSLSWFLSKPVRRWEYLWGKILAVLLTIFLISISTSLSFMLSVINFVDPIYIPDVVSIGGFMFLNELLTLLPLAALVMLFSSAVKQSGLAIFLPILVVMILPIAVAFLPMVTRHEWPMLLSLNYYSEALASAWISSSGGFLSSMGSMGQMLGIDITPLNLTIPQIVLILSCITIVSLVVSTIALEKGDIA
ncbi:MAG: ABC transporter permease [Candidatus Hodarchaeota archaeon]